MKIKNAFNVRPRPKSTPRGCAGFDNPRENIDPHIKTKVLSSREGSIEKTPVNDNDIANKKYVDDNSASPGGSDTNIQFNNSSNLGGSSSFTWNDSRCDVIFTMGATADETKGFGLTNNTPATLGNPQYSPSLYFKGSCYRTSGPGSGAKTTEWRAYHETSSSNNLTLASFLKFQMNSSEIGTSWTDVFRMRGTSKNENTGVDVYGPNGPVSNTGLYSFTIQNNATGVDFQIINSTYNVEGVGFFTGIGDTFQIYCTEGGGLEVYPDDAESLLALKISNEGTCTLANNTSANDVLLRLDQAETAYGFIDFQGSTGANTTSPVSTYTTSGAVQGHIQIEINGVKRWIAFLDDPSA